MPTYFIAPYKTDAVNSNVRIIILLPARVATRNIHDISVWMKGDPQQPYVYMLRYRLHDQVDVLPKPVKFLKMWTTGLP